jgi:hypothetical protein
VEEGRRREILGLEECPDDRTGKAQFISPTKD